METDQSHPRQHQSEENLEGIVGLADTIRDLIDQLDRIQQTLDRHEITLLHEVNSNPETSDPQTIHPKPETLSQWQGFIEGVIQELDTLSPLF